MNASDNPQSAIEDFLLHEARLLDEARYEEWLALFTDDGWYWVPSQPDQKSPKDTVSLIYDDRRLLETRVRRLANPHIHAQQPASRASRTVANVTIERRDGPTVDTRSKLVMVEYRRHQQRVFAGTCWHRLVGTEGRLRIASKRVDLINCDSELDGIAIPL